LKPWLVLPLREAEVKGVKLSSDLKTIDNLFLLQQEPEISESKW
jgi:hypothetical protein